MSLFPSRWRIWREGKGRSRGSPGGGGEAKAEGGEEGKMGEGGGMAKDSLVRELLLRWSSMREGRRVSGGGKEVRELWLRRERGGGEEDGELKGLEA